MTTPSDSPAAASTVETATVVSVPFDENTYVFRLAGRTDCVVFDPGLQPQAIIDLLEERGLTPAAILCTHGHSDHIAGNEALKERWPEAPLVIGRGDAYKLTDPVANLSAMFGSAIRSPEADATVTGGDAYEAAGMTWRVVDTPGHSAGHVSFLLDGPASEGAPARVHAVAGDVLFRGSVGRSDFPDGDSDTLCESIHTQLFTLPDDTIVYPGHGPTTTVREEKQSNPFVGAPAGYRET